jgi:site-specific DNA recombinase
LRRASPTWTACRSRRRGGVTLDRWLLRAFEPDSLPATIAALADAQDDRHDGAILARAIEARRVIADCDQRVARYRAALEAGTDPALVARWTAEVTATRAAAQIQLRDADPDDKAEAYHELGRRLTYQPGHNTVIAEARPSAIMYEGLCRRSDRYRNPTRTVGRPRHRVRREMLIGRWAMANKASKNANVAGRWRDALRSCC